MKATFPSLGIKDKEKRFDEESWIAPIHQGLILAEREQFHAKGKEFMQLIERMKAFEKELNPKDDGNVLTGYRIGRN